MAFDSYPGIPQSTIANTVSKAPNDCGIHGRILRYSSATPPACVAKSNIVHQDIWIFHDDEYYMNHVCSWLWKNYATLWRSSAAFSIVLDFIIHWLAAGILLCMTEIWLTHWGRVTHICVSNLTIIGSDNGFSPGRRQVIIWTNAGVLFIWPLGTNLSEILIEILTFSFTKMRFKVSSGKWRPFCLGLNLLILVLLVIF